MDFSTRNSSLEFARFCCDVYADAKRQFLETPKKDWDARSFRAIELQKAKHDMNDAVRKNRSRFKLLIGDKP